MKRVKKLLLLSFLGLFLMISLSTTSSADTIISGGFIRTDTIWTLEGSPYIITGDVYVYGSGSTATLTIEPGVEIRFNTNIDLYIGGSSSNQWGALVAQGTAENKIKFTSSNPSPAPGDWPGITFNNYNRDDLTILEHCEIDYGGGNRYGNLYFIAASGTVNNCTISNSSTQGIYLYASSSPTISDCIIDNNVTDGIASSSNNDEPAITGNSLSGNGEYPIHIYPNAAGKAKNNSGTGNRSDRIRVSGGVISKNTTWSKQGLSYLITGDVSVYGSGSTATLTIEPGVEIRFNTNIDLYIGGSSSNQWGALVAQGTAENKIKFTSSNPSPAPGDWPGITFNNYNRDDLTILEHCEIDYGGGNRYGNLYFIAASGTVNNCTISNSSTQGIYLYASSSPIISNCNISDNTEYPISLSLNEIEKIKNNSGTGNRSDSIRVSGGVVSKNTTWSNQGLSYLITGDVNVYGSGSTATLTIESGVEVRFNTNVDLYIGGSSSNQWGALIAQGTSENKIKFTSSKASPSPGDWSGIYFNNYSNDELTILEHCIIEYGGTNGNLNLFYASPVIQYNTIQHGLTHGVQVYGTGSNNAKINCNTIQDNVTGIYLRSSANPEISRNNFRRNLSYGVNNTGSVLVDISSNWWNDANGPGFNGEEVYGNVNFADWLIVESDCINNDPTNKAPFAASTPSPANAAVRVITTDEALNVTWTGTDPNVWDSLTYDVYLGTESANLSLVAENLAQSQFELTSLLYGTTYFWKVISKDTGGLATAGPVWQFTTEGLPSDLVVDSLVWNPTADIQAGQDITFTVTVKNSGAGPCVDPFQVVLRVDGSVEKTWDVSQMVNIEETLDLISVWNAQTGDHTIEVEVDSTKAAIESIEDNNIFSSAINGIIDPAPPALVGTGPVDNSFSQQVNQVVITLADEHGQVDDAAVIAGFIVRDQGGQIVAGSVVESNDVFTFTPSVSPFAAGVYSVSVTAKDIWGNTIEYNFSFTVDVQAPANPVITGGEVATGTIAVQPAVNKSRVPNITLTGTREDDTRVMINETQRVDFGTGNWSAALALPAGNNTLEIYLEDRAGNMSSSVFVDIVLDSVAPVINSVSPADNSFFNPAPSTIVVDYTEVNSELDRNASILSVKDITLTPVPGSWDYIGGSQLVFTPTVPFSESVFQVELRLQDTLGNQGNAQMTHFTVDLTSPAPPVIATVTTPTNASSQMISGTKEPYAAIWMNGVKVVENTDQADWSYLVTLVSGQNQFSFTAVDRADNQSEPALAEIVFDDTPPLAVNNLSVNPDGDGMSVVLNWNGYDETVHGDIVSYRVYVNPATFGSTSGLTPYTTVNAGVFEAPVQSLSRKTPYWFAVVAVDNGGNALETVSPITSTPNDIVAPENPSDLFVQCFENSLILNWEHSANSGADLAGYKIYFNGTTEGTPIDKALKQFEQTGLTPATAYDFKLTSLDEDGNESLGVVYQGITLLNNPANLAVTPFSGYVTLSWDAVLPTQYIKQYNIYVNQTPFTSVEGLTPRRSVTGVSGNISGLTNDTAYYFAVTTVNLSDGEQKQATAVSATPTDDTQGPQLSSILFEDAPLVDGQNLTTSGKIRVVLNDPAGVSAVEFYFNGSMIRKDYSEPYTAYIDIFIVPDGSYPLIVTAYDTLGNSASYEYTLVAGLDAPAAPVITVPENNAVTNRIQMNVKGTSDKYTDVSIFLDGVDTGAVVSVGPVGTFTIPVVLNEGENRLKAVAENRTGTSPESVEIQVTVDTSLPDSPRSLSGQSKPDGEIKLLWQRPLNKVVEGFNIYRSNSSFQTKDQAVLLNTSLVNAAGYIDLPSGEGVWFYRVTAVDAAGNESDLCNEAAVESDDTDPVAVRIEYTSNGKVDPVLHRYAPGRVDIVLEVSEPLSALPFLTMTPGGGIPQSVEFEKVSDLIYTGVFQISDTMPEGYAYAVFSARDLAGNRGTAVTQGDRLLLDTKGPSISRLDIQPASPVKNDSQNPVELQLAFGLTENMKPGEFPQIRLDISNGRQVVDVIGLVQVNAQTGEAQAWQGTVVLPDDAGLAAPETMEIQYSGIDDLDNISTAIQVNHTLQVYQGGLPPLAPPAALTGQALAGGRIELAWEPVEQASGYQILRQAPEESELTLLDTIEPLTSYIDNTTVDGTYLYSVATIRQENGEESVSGPSNTQSVDSDSIAPDAPSNLALDVIAQGVRAQWQAPAYTEAITYSIYRADQAGIASIQGLSPLVTDINQTMIIDPTPAPDKRCYAIVAVDATGNESLQVSACYSNFDLLPVSVLEVSQKDYDPPQIIWSHADNTGNVAGFYAFIGKDKSGFKVNEALMTDTAFTDYGYAGEDRSYAVIAVDVNDVESMTRFVTLPKETASPVQGSLIKRGIMNKLEYTVQNESSAAVNNIVVKADLAGHSHPSESFSLAVGESKVIPVIVGGYSELADMEILTTTIEICANPGEKAKIIRTQDIEVLDSLMVLQIGNDPLLRGGLGKIWFTLENSGAAEVDIVTAEAGYNKPSAEITCYLMDEDANVLYSKSFIQSLGNHIQTLANKRTIARIPAGETFTSVPMDLFIPANAPDDVYVRLEISNIYYHLGRTDQVKMDGTQTRRQISLKDTSYSGQVISALPAVSSGDEDIVITGSAIERGTEDLLAQMPLNLIITVNGFERKIKVTTDETGTFTHTFVPLENEAGIFHVQAVHPDLLDRPEQATFIINQVNISPAKIQLSIPKNYEQKITVRVKTETGTSLTNLRLELAKPFGTGVHLDLGTPIPEVGPDRTVALNMILWADNSADELGAIELAVKSDESPEDPWGSILINTQFSESLPVLYFTPDHIETGVARDDIVSENITLENKGLADMGDVFLELIDENGQAAPDWVRLNTPSNIGTLKVGQSQKVSISFLPGTQISEGMKTFYLRVTSSNYPQTDIGLYPTVTASGIGNVLFKASDIYTGTFNAKNELIRGLANAKITLQRDMSTDSPITSTTDSLGEVLFEDLVVGSYKCVVTAANHQQYTGRIWVKPGITVNKAVFLEYNLVTVEWEVNEITIEDKYEIFLTATFETDVPAAVVVAQPLSVTLPDMEKGDVYHGEFILINHGLIRADELTIPIPKSDENFQFEILSGLPQTLEAKQRITIPYRITCLKSLDQEENTDSGGGCYTYSNCMTVSFGFPCANGGRSKGSTQHCFYKSGGTCGGSGGNTGSSGGTSGGSSQATTVILGTVTGGGTVSNTAPASTPMVVDDKKCLPKPDPKECNDCKESGQNTDTSVGSAINHVYRQFTDEAVDLFIQTPGGRITIAREYEYGKWSWNNFSTVMDGRPDDNLKVTSKKVSVLSEYGPDYVTKDHVPYEKVSPGVYKNDTYIIERKTDCGQYVGTSEWSQCMSGNAEDYLEDKYVFKDKSGNWKKYDSSGRLMSYGNRYGTIAALMYDSPDDKHPSGIMDKNDNQVLWFDYDTDDNLTRVYDADARQVTYDYLGDNLVRVVDLMEKETLYAYDNKNNLTKKTNAEGHATTITYNQTNDPIKVEDDRGGIFLFEYDYDKNKKEYYARIQSPASKIKEVWYNDKGETKRVDSNGRTLQKISPESRINTIIDEAKNTTLKEYDERDNLKKVTYPDSSTVLYEYDLRFNKVKTKQDQLGRITQYEYDAAGNLITKTQAANTANEQVTSYTHDAMGRVLTVTTHADTVTSEAVTTFTYDENGNLASITDPELNTTLFTSYDIMGNLLEKTDARGKTWTYEYDAKGRLKSATNPLSHKTSYEYDGIDNRTAMITPDLKRFEYTYDAKANLVKTTDPLSNITQFEYSLDGKLLKQIDPENKETAYEYDADRRLLNTVDGSGNTTTMEYSQGGCSSCSGTTSKPARVIFPTFEKSFTYDSLGRKLSETDTLSESLAYTTQFEYDTAGNLLRKTDRMGKDTHYVYDDLNRLKLVVDPAGENTNYTYDSRGNLIELTDADQNTTGFEYDTNNRLVKETRPMGEETLYEYDAAGNLIRKTDAKNQKTEYEYDDANRLTYIYYYTTAQDTTPVKTVSFNYDIKGNLVSYSDGTTTGTYTYDDLNRKLTDTTNFGPFEKTLAYTWHKNSLKKSFTPPDSDAISYAYNENNQLAGIEIPGLGTISYGSYNWTRPQTTQLPGGSTTTRTYDALMRTDSITVKDPGANPVMAYTYNFDPMDNITQKASEHGEYNYTYDDLYRLTDSDNPDVPELTDETFTYDPVGNRLTASDTQGTWAYNNNNELETHGDTSYVYDANGNMTQKTVNGIVTRFFYNIEDRLIRVEDGSSNVIASYTYDPFGRRLSKTVSGITTYYFYSDEGLVAEYTATGTELKSYGWKPGSTWGTDPLFMKEGAEYYFYHNDHLGTPQKMTAVNGAVVWSAKYSSFLDANVDPSSTITNNLRAPGQYFDSETNLHYNFYRYYDPTTGRYIKVDPIGLSGGLNLFEYSFGNPISYFDDTGLTSIHACALACWMGISFGEFKALEKAYANEISRQGYSKELERDIRKQVEREFKDQMQGMSKKKRKKYIANIVKSRAKAKAMKKIKRKGAMNFGKYLLGKAGGSVAPGLIAKMGLKGLAGPIGWAMWGYDALKYGNCYRMCAKGCY